MPRIRVDNVVPGAIPSERIVVVTDARGETHESIAHVSHLSGDDGMLLEVGEAVAYDHMSQRSLVELPNATAKGFWRIWIGTVQLVR